LLVFGLGVVATTALASLPSLGGHTLLFGLTNLAAPAVVNAALFLVAFRVLTPSRIPTGRLLVGAVVAGVLFTLLQAVGGYLVGHNLKHAQAVYGFFAVVLGLMSWLFLSAQGHCCIPGDASKQRDCRYETPPHSPSSSSAICLCRLPLPV
jgi:uncharacterized BrkB/YihY/UPF0761 family membrane protein